MGAEEDALLEDALLLHHSEGALVAFLCTTLLGAATAAHLRRLLPEALLGAVVEDFAVAAAHLAVWGLQDAAADVLLELAPTANFATCKGTASTLAASAPGCRGKKI